MKKIILNLRSITDRDALYDAVTEAFSFPAYFGRNLDALYDCLTEIAEDTCVALLLPEGTEEEAADDGLPELARLDGFDAEYANYIEKVRRTFEDAEEENPRLHVIVVG